MSDRTSKAEPKTKSPKLQRTALAKSGSINCPAMRRHTGSRAGMWVASEKGIGSPVSRPKWRATVSHTLRQRKGAWT